MADDDKKKKTTDSSGEGSGSSSKSDPPWKASKKDDEKPATAKMPRAPGRDSKDTDKSRKAVEDDKKEVEDEVDEDEVDEDEVDEDEVDEDEVDEDEVDEDDNDDNDDAPPPARKPAKKAASSRRPANKSTGGRQKAVAARRPATPSRRPEQDNDEDWLPDWAPWAVLIGLLVVGLLGALGVFTPKHTGPTAADVGTSTSAADTAAPRPTGTPDRVNTRGLLLKPNLHLRLPTQPKR